MYMNVTKRVLAPSSPETEPHPDSTAEPLSPTMKITPVWTRDTHTHTSRPHPPFFTPSPHVLQPVTVLIFPFPSSLPLSTFFFSFFFCFHLTLTHTICPFSSRSTRFPKATDALRRSQACICIWVDFFLSLAATVCVRLTLVFFCLLGGCIEGNCHQKEKK